MTFLGPTRSSRKPKMMVATPAVTLAATPNRITSPKLKPKVPRASTAPKVNTPDRPSRNRAEASRK